MISNDPMQLSIYSKLLKKTKTKEELLQCEIEQFTYNFHKKLAVLELPMYNCTDMTGAIAYCLMVDKKVKQIQVYEAKNLINVYYKIGDEWTAGSFKRHAVAQ